MWQANPFVCALVAPSVACVTSNRRQPTTDEMAARHLEAQRVAPVGESCAGLLYFCIFL